MKIEDQGAFEAARISGVNPVQRTGPAFSLFGAYGLSAAQGADSAALSIQAQELRKFTSQVKNLPDIREDKLQTLKQQLDQGSYQVEPADLAEVMFRMAELDGLP